MERKKPTQNLKRRRGIFLKVFFLTTGILAILILVGGYFYGILKVPWPEYREPEFPEKEYMSASNFYKEELDISYFNIEVIRQEVSSFMIESIPEQPVEKIISSLDTEYRGKLVIYKVITGNLYNDSFAQKYKRLKNMFQAEKDALNRKLNEAGYFERSEIIDQIEVFRKRLKSVEELNDFVSNYKIRLIISSPYRDKFERFSYIAGRFVSIKLGRSNQINLEISKPRPVTEIEFLERAKIAEVKINRIKLESDRDMHIEIRRSAKARLQAEIEREKERIKARIAPQRQYVRNQFYLKWYSVFVMTIISFFMLVILMRYFSIIRRKGLPKKTTHEIYFATNITSQITRWIALAIIIFGMIGLVVNLFIAIFATRSPLPVIRNIGFIYGITTPISTTISTFLLSWTFVLIAEFICFISNCYHVMFKKAYENNKSVM